MKLIFKALIAAGVAVAVFEAIRRTDAVNKLIDFAAGIKPVEEDPTEEQVEGYQYRGTAPAPEYRVTDIHNDRSPIVEKS